MVIRVFSGWSVRRGLNRDLVHCPWLCCRDQFTRFTSHLWTTFLYLFWMYWILQASLLLHGSMGYSVHLVQNYATKFSIMIYKYIILLSKKKKRSEFSFGGFAGITFLQKYDCNQKVLNVQLLAFSVSKIWKLHLTVSLPASRNHFCLGKRRLVKHDRTFLDWSWINLWLEFQAYQ